MSNEIRIAISGKSGCGNSTVTRDLAAAMGIHRVNYTFHNMAEEMGIPFEDLSTMAEADNKWDYLVDERQIAQANQGPCVLGSRLAIWIWKQARLRVYLTAPLEVRSQRILTREGGTLEGVRDATQRRDARDHARFLRLYGIDNDHYEFADLVIDTSTLSPQEIVDLIRKTWDQGPGRA